MIVEIPDERIIAWTGCHPDTPVKEALIWFLSDNKSSHYNFFNYVGEYVIRNAKELK